MKKKSQNPIKIELKNPELIDKHKIIGVPREDLTMMFDRILENNLERKKYFNRMLALTTVNVFLVGLTIFDIVTEC